MLIMKHSGVLFSVLATEFVSYSGACSQDIDFRGDGKRLREAFVSVDNRELFALKNISLPSLKLVKITLAPPLSIFDSGSLR